MRILSQYHIFELDTINIYSVNKNGSLDLNLSGSGSATLVLKVTLSILFGPYSL